MNHGAPETALQHAEIVALFPRCSACGVPLSPADRLEPDPDHPFRMKHAGPCPPLVTRRSA